MFGIPAYCPTCDLMFSHGPRRDASGRLHGFMNLGRVEIHGSGTNIQTRCPKGHVAYLINGSYSIKDGLLEIAKTRPPVLREIGKIAGDGKSGKIDPVTALNKIQKLAPEISPAIKQQLRLHDRLFILQLIITLLAAIPVYVDLFMKDAPMPQIIVNGDVTIVQSGATRDEGKGRISEPLTQEQLRKQKQLAKKKQKKKQKARRKLIRAKQRAK